MVRLATFNLYQFAEPGSYWYEEKPRNSYSYDDWTEKQRWIVDQLALMNADIVGFQEVFAIDGLRDLCRRAGYQNFFTVDTPKSSDDNDRVFVAPVVALASRHRISSAAEVPIAADMRSKLPLAADFNFSRKPIRAVVELPGVGPLVVYVVHLKSKRPIADAPTFAGSEDWEHKTRETMRAISIGHSASLLQRGAEAAMLFHALSEEIAQDRRMPVVVLGDLNDDPASIPIEAITMRGRIDEIDGVDDENWPEDVVPAIHDHRFRDAWSQANRHQRRRAPTHYHRGEGGVLDYILVSNALNPKNPDRRGRVTSCDVFNNHLRSDDVPNHLQSDHGQVVATLAFDATRRRSDAARAEPKTAANWVDAQDGRRSDFMEAAGGVFMAKESYGYWSGHDKYRNFWAFFFDNDYGWVKSAYGSIPISELHQKQRYSIEHIIPKIFLREYLKRRGTPTEIRRGASVNPLNFVAAERKTNADRNNFPFDWDNDELRRPARIPLNPDAYVATGLDHEDEWIIPLPSRGELARAILYMVIAYDISELYNQHIDQLRHWAKVDPANTWEIDYNRWVESRLGIRNPLIDRPDKARRWLDDHALMDSIRVTAEG